MPASVCEACTARDCLRVFKAREMMFGLRHVFDYGECRECGSIQILQVPADLSEYYPDGYYSRQPPSTSGMALRRWLARQRQEHVNGTVNLTGRMLSTLFGPPLFTDIDWIRLAGIRREHRVLDVGCGSGAILTTMRERGFRDLTGVDPNMRTETRSEGFVLLRKQLADLTGPFDVVMLHHSFEHMPDPAGNLREISRVLTEEGVALISTPVAGSYAWRTYGANWFQIDPPRHLFIPSNKGLGVLARRTGFNVVTTVYNSNYMQFTASEKYTRDIPLRMPDDRHYTRREMRLFAEKARRLNEAMDGDQAAFVLRKVASP